MAFTAAKNPTLMDIAIRNGADRFTELIDETIEAHPEIALMPARTIKGINYKTLVRTGLPTVGFRNANEGSADDKGVYENRLVETFIFNPQWAVDKAVADRSEDGASAYMATEAGGIMEASLQWLASQFWYGRGTASTAGIAIDPSLVGDAKGFYGLLELSERDSIVVSATNLIVDAGGTTANTGASVYMLRSGPRHIQWVWGEGGSLVIEDATVQRVLDGSSNAFTAYTQELISYPGLQVGSTLSFGRIGELTEDSGLGLTDLLLAELYAKFPVGGKPDKIFMNRRSQRQLRDSRLTGTGMTIMASGQPVDFPESWMNVPIHITDALQNNEEVGVLS